MLLHYDVLLLIATNIAALFIMAIIAFARTVGHGLRASVIVTIFSLLFWQNTIYFADNLNQHLIFWNTLVFVWPTLAVGSFFLFVWFLRNSGTDKYRPSRLLAWAVGIGVAIQCFALFWLHIFDAVTYSGGIYEFTRGSGYYVYIIGLVIGFVAMIIALITSTIRSHHGSREQRAFKTVLWTVVCAILYGVVANILIPVLFKTQAFISLGIITVDIFAVGFGLSVIKGRLLDVRFYVVRTATYVLSLLSLAAIYYLLAFAVSRAVLHNSISIEPISIVIALGLAFIFQPTKRFFDRLTNRLFYHDSYDSSVFTAEFSRILTLTTDLRGLLERAAGHIGDTLKAEQVFFFVRYNTSSYVSVGTKQHKKIPEGDVTLLDTYVNATHISSLMSDSLVDDGLRRMLVSHKITVVLPLRSSDSLIGYLFLGDHLGSGYTRRDMRVLESISSELVIAIQNALSVHEVRELNNTLQQRIDEATKELRASNEQLRRLDESKDEFVSMASHQLRTPLTSVKGYISMLLEGDAGKINETQKHFLGEAFTSSERMVHLINDFLNVSRLQTGKFVIDRREVDLATIATQEVDSLRTTAGQRKLTLKLNIYGTIPPLFLDESKIRQVIMNFIDNALYYSAGGTTIHIELRIEDDDVVLTIKDTGIGVPVDEQAHLFTKFYRASNARKQRPDGTGVGLFLAKKVIVSHGGEVVFESVVGKGSTFGFRLPIKKLERAPANDTNDLDN